MRQILYILTFSILFLAYSCDNRFISRFTETKEASSTTEEVKEVPIEKTTSIRNTGPIEYLTQTELFENMVDAMYLNDMTSYRLYIERFNNVDTLVLFTPTGDQQEMYYSLLGMACKQNSLTAMKDLVARGADIKLGSRDEFSAYDALYYAIMGGNAEMVKILVDKGTDVNLLYTSSGITPLVFSVMHNKLVMAEILLIAGAKVDGAGNLGDNDVLYPLHDAIRLNDVEMVKLLLKYNADTKLKDKEGLDAMNLAKNMKADEISALLKKK